jgi:hypothetical protein
MAYDNNIPQANDLISQSQAQILENFSQLDTQYSGDHVAFSAATNNGEHTKVSFSNVSAPGAQTDPKSVLYTKSPVGGIFSHVLPFFRNQSAELNVLPDLSNTGTNYSFSLGQIIFNFGSGVIASGTSSLTVSWKTPFTTNLLTVLCTKNGNGIGSSGNTVTMNANASASPLTQCNFVSQSTLSSGNLPFYYLAIGY